MGYYSQIIQDKSGLFALEREWNQLFEKSLSSNVFLIYDWIASWANHFDHILFIIVIRNDMKELVGIAPLCIHSRIQYGVTLKILSFIAEGPSDYQDFIIIENREIVIDKLLATINAYKAQWDVVELSNLDTNSANYKILCNKKYSFRQSIADTGYKILFKDVSEVNKMIHQKTTYDILYNIRRLKKEGEVEIVDIVNEDQIDEFLNIFFRLHTKRWNLTSTKSMFNDENIRSLFQSIAHKMFAQKVALYSYLKVDKAIVACHFGFKYQDTIYWYIPSFDTDYNKFSPGKIFLYFVIQRQLNQGIIYFDLLRGTEAYKKNFGSISYNTHKLTRFKKSWRYSLFIIYQFYNQHRDYPLFRIYRKLCK